MRSLAILIESETTCARDRIRGESQTRQTEIIRAIVLEGSPF